MSFLVAEKTEEEKRRRCTKERKKSLADGPTDAFPRFFVETCARRVKRKGWEIQLPLGWGGGGKKNCPTIQDSAGNRYASEGWIRLTREGVAVFFPNQNERVTFLSFFFFNLWPSNNRSVTRTLGHRGARNVCKQRFVHSWRFVWENPASLMTYRIKGLSTPRDIFVHQISVEKYHLFVTINVFSFDLDVFQRLKNRWNMFLWIFSDR